MRQPRLPQAVWLAVAAGLLCLLPAVAATGPSPSERRAPDHYEYEDLPAGTWFPAPEYVLLGKVLDDDLPAVRQHAWRLWAAVTAPSQSVWSGQRLPVFETWYSIPEVFNPEGKAGARRRLQRHFTRPTQMQLARVEPGGAAAGLMSFVKYNRAAAEFVWANGYYRRSTLEALNQRFDRERTPVVERGLKPFPSGAVALKLVFWLVKNPASPQSERGLTALPYWDPSYPPPPGGVPPMHTTWTKAVAIDPGGRYPIGSLQQVHANGRVVRAPVVPLSRFYAHQMRDPAEVADARIFMDMFSSAQNEQERFVTNPGQRPELNDYLILLAMHLTTKELDDWAFQTFWWSPEPDAPPFGHDRPGSLRGPFANYLARTAYSTVTPRESDGGPPICFNPYLETDLGPTRPYDLDSKTYPPDPMAGTRSNCQNCHRRAGFPAFERQNPHAASFGHVYNDGYRSPNDPYFARMVKTEFLWSIALKGVEDPKR